MQVKLLKILNVSSSFLKTLKMTSYPVCDKAECYSREFPTFNRDSRCDALSSLYHSLAALNNGQSLILYHDFRCILPHDALHKSTVYYPLFTWANKSDYDDDDELSDLCTTVSNQISYHHTGFTVNRLGLCVCPSVCPSCSGILLKRL